MSAPKLWIVEMWNDNYHRVKPRWEPTIGAGLGREQARLKLAEWKTRNNSDRFRIRVYSPTK